jgi:hypothetical protein
MIIDQLIKQKYNQSAANYMRRKRAGLVVPKHTKEPKSITSIYMPQRLFNKLEEFRIKRGFSNRSNATVHILETFLGVDDERDN